MKFSITEQAIEAAKLVDTLFDDDIPPMPSDATIELLWKELCRLKGKSKKPKKVDAIKLLLEHESLTSLPVPLIADIIQKVFKHHGLACNTNESCIRWYITQKTLEWNIKPRDKLKDVY